MRKKIVASFRGVLAVILTLLVVACDSAKSQNDASSFHRPGGLIMAMVFAPSGQVLTSAGSASIRSSLISSLQKSDSIWSSNAKEYSPGDLTMSLAYSSDGQWLAAGLRSGTIKIWKVGDDEASPTVFTSVCGPDGSPDINAIAFSPQTNSLAVGCFNGALVLLDIDQPKATPIVLNKKSDNQVTVVSFSADGGLLAADTLDNTISLWSIGDLQQEPNIITVPGRPISSLDFSPNGELLAISAYDGGIWLWDAKQPASAPKIVVSGTGSLDVKDAALSVCFTFDSQHIAAGYAETVRVWDATQSNALVGEFAHFRGDVQVACSPTEDIIASATDDIVRFLSLDTAGNLPAPSITP